ncbi:MAG: hypothetical protein ACD_7C00310G0004 [uncultured bacterium]|nr:MAG: hypothetical protein ACD_7C00310G0004 [uncultured bacterium]HBR78851.1 hypothetical protein [Candidatus Moranbacteria bacterium]
MSEKKDPFKSGAEMGADIMAELDALENSNKDTQTWDELRAEIDRKFDDEIKSLEGEEQSVKNPAEGLPFTNKIKKIKKLKKDLFEIFDNPEFSVYRSKKSNAKRLNEYARIITEQAINNNDGIGEFEPINDLLKVAKNPKTPSKTIIKILNTIKVNKEAEATKLKEEEERIKADEEVKAKEAERKAKEAEEARLKKEEEEKIKAAEAAEFKKAQEEKLKAEEAAKRKKAEADRVKAEAAAKAKKTAEAKKAKKAKAANKKPKSKEEKELDYAEKEISHLKAEIKVAEGRLQSVEDDINDEDKVNDKDKNKKKKTKLEEWIHLQKEKLVRLESERDAIKEKHAKEAQKNSETNEAEPKIELTEAEKNEAVEFFDNHILPLYMGEKQKQGWSEYNNRVEEFLERKFFEIAEALDYFEGYDDLKMAEIWKFVASEMQAKIEALEKESQETSANKDKYKDKEFTLEEIYARLQAAGADDQDINYFFSLHKKDRLDFLMSDDEELKLRIEKLKEIRKADEGKRSEAENSEATEKLKRFGEYMKDMRNIYLQKEYEFNKTTSKMKRFFRVENVDMGNAQEELDDAKKDYREAVENYIKLIVQTEGATDAEESEIMLNYFNVQEALNLQEEKIQIKHSNDPELLQLTENVLGKGLKGYLKGYKTVTTYLSKKSSEFVAQKTDSKLAKLAGGFVGGMAFSVGLSNAFKTTGAPYWATKAILLAASTAAMTMENKEKMDKELEQNEIDKIAERKLKALEEINLNLQADLNEAMKKVFVSVVNESLDYQEGKEERNRKMWLEAFGKAAKHNLKWFLIGLGTAEVCRSLYECFASPESNLDNQPNVNEEKVLPSKEETVIPPVGNVGGSAVHPQTNFPHPVVTADYEMPSNVNDPILENEAEIRETLEKMKNPNHFSSPEAHHEASQSAREINNAETVAGNKGTITFDRDDTQVESSISAGEYAGIKLNESGQGPIEVIEGKGIKDTVAALLAKNYENLTQGKMGWNPDKYASVEEWADRRAVGIVAELKADHPDYNYDKVSLDSQITLDMHNPADIKIVDFVDGQDLESGAGNASEMQTESTEAAVSESQEIEDKIEDKVKTATKPEIKAEEIANTEKMSQNVADVRKEIIAEETIDQETIQDIRENTAKIETQAANRIGIDPKHYAEINHMSTAEFIAEAKRADNIVHGGGEDSMDVNRSSELPVGNVFGDDEMANTRLGRVLDYLMKDGKIENPSQSIAETLRNVKEADLMGAIRTYEGIFGDISDSGSAMELNEDEMYAEYMSSLIKAELNDMLGSSAGEGKIMRELAGLRGIPMEDLSDKELLMAFKEATKNSIGTVEYGNNETVGKYILKTIRLAYETGEIDKLRENISKINISNMQGAV